MRSGKRRAARHGFMLTFSNVEPPSMGGHVHNSRGLLCVTHRLLWGALSYHGEVNHNAKTQNNVVCFTVVWLRGIESVRGAESGNLSTGSETQRGNGENA